MQLDDGTEVECHHEQNWVVRLDARQILNGRSYPILPGVSYVGTVLDIGASCGAAAVSLARAYPSTTIWSFEPAATPFSYAERNAVAHPSIRPVHLGLLDRDGEAELFTGKASAGRHRSSPATSRPATSRSSSCAGHRGGSMTPASTGSASSRWTPRDARSRS